MGSSALAYNKPTQDLVKLQSFMRDWAEARRTPFGTAIPKYALPVFARGLVQVPVFGTQVTVVTFQAKANWTTVLSGLVLQFQATPGAGPEPGPGDVQFTIDIDRELGTGNGYIVKDYNAVPFELGSFVGGAYWPCEIKPKNTEILRIKATPIANVGTGLGNFFTCAIMGWEWPAQGFEGA